MSIAGISGTSLQAGQAKHAPINIDNHIDLGKTVFTASNGVDVSKSSIFAPTKAKIQMGTVTEAAAPDIKDARAAMDEYEVQQKQMPIK